MRRESDCQRVEHEDEAIIRTVPRRKIKIRFTHPLTGSFRRRLFESEQVDEHDVSNCSDCC